MTLILTQISHRYILQVSDRLISCKYPDGRVEPVDSRSNKSIIYWARDGIVSLSYSGKAYLENLPTDQWIAEKLSGKSFPKCTSGIPSPLVMSGFAPDSWLDMGRSLNSLAESLRAVFQSLPESERNFPFRVAVAGWQWKRRNGRIRPTGVVVTLNSNRFKLFRSRRYFFDTSYLLQVTPPGWMTRSDVKQLLKNLDSLFNVNMHDMDRIDKAEAMLAEAIRLVAGRTNQSQIGRDCFSILIPHPYHRDYSGRVRVRFLPEIIHTSKRPYDQPPDNTENIAVPVAYSPWIIAGDWVHWPALLTSKVNWKVDPWTFELEGPYDKLRNSLWIFPQPRPTSR